MTAPSNKNKPQPGAKADHGRGLELLPNRQCLQVEDAQSPERNYVGTQKMTWLKTRYQKIDGCRATNKVRIQRQSG